MSGRETAELGSLTSKQLGDKEEARGGDNGVLGSCSMLLGSCCGCLFARDSIDGSAKEAVGHLRGCLGGLRSPDVNRTGVDAESYEADEEGEHLDTLEDVVDTGLIEPGAGVCPDRPAGICEMAREGERWPDVSS